MSTSGIYKITSPSNRVYIGQSCDIDRRFKEYKQLKKSVKSQVLLHRSFQKYDIENHTFEVIEECSIEILNIKERHWQEFYNSLEPNGLNCKYTNTDTKNSVLSQETKNKISRGKLGSKYSDEHRTNLSIANKGKHSYLNSEEVKQKRITSIKLLKSIKLINIETGIIHDSIILAAEAENINLFKLRRMLSDTSKQINTTNLRKII